MNPFTGVRVGLVDDHTVVRQAVGQMIDADPAMSVVAQAGSLAEAEASGLAGRCDVLVVDVSLGDGSGLDFVRAVRKASPTIGLVVLTMHRDDDVLFEALEAGASGLVLKSDPSDTVLAAIRQAAVAPRAFTAAGLVEAMQRRAENPSRLTPREREVLGRLVAGDSVDQVATTLYMSRSTVKTHVAKLYEKLEVRNRAGLVMEAVRLGLVRQGDVAR